MTGTRKNSKTRASRADRGQIASMFALLLPVLLGLVGLVIDGGMAMVQYRRAQVAMDSAALAAATQLDRERFTADDTVQLSPAQAVAEAIRYAQQNDQGHLSVTGINVSGARVDVHGTVTSPTIFMRIFGINQVHLNLSSRAELKYGITEEGQ
jgi:Flp pilus assembly protein TadG